MRASIIIEASDRASQVFGRLAARARGVSRGIDDIEDEARDADRGLDRMGRRGTRSMERLGRAAHRVGVGIGNVARTAASFAATGALAAGALAVGFFQRVFSITSQFEQFQVILENTEGSAEKARQSMAWVQTFAQVTPFELAEVMEAFVSLKNYGIDPTNGSLRALGDMASGMGRPMLEAVEAMASAMTGEFEELKKFGIQAEVAGDSVTFSYRKNGQEIVRTARKNALAIEASLVGIMNDKFAGMMERQSRTLAGIWANLQDAASKFMLRVGQAGVFDRVKARAEALLTMINNAEGNPRLQAFIETMSETMGDLADRAFDFVEKTDWASVANGVASIVGEMITLVEWIGKAATLMERLDALDRGVSAAVINASPFASAQERRAANAEARRTGVDSGLYEWITGPASNSTAANGPPSAQRRSVAPARPSPSTPRPMTPRATPRSGQRPAARAEPTRVGGRIDVRVSMGPELSSRLTRLETANSNVPITASRGPVSTS